MNTETDREIRELTDAELDQVVGGAQLVLMGLLAVVPLVIDFFRNLFRRRA